MKRALLFGGVPVLAGIALIVVWALAEKAASRGTDWTQILGTIESVKTQPGAIDIAYRYERDGRQYRNPAGRLTLRDGAKPTDRHTAGRQILAYVNPTNPAESILEPLPSPSPFNLIAGSVLLIMGLPLGIYLIYESQRPYRATRRKPIRRPTKPVRPTRPTRPTRPPSRLKPPSSTLRKK